MKEKKDSMKPRESESRDEDRHLPRKNILGDEPANEMSPAREREELKKEGYTDEGLTHPWEDEGESPAEDSSHITRRP